MNKQTKGLSVVFLIVIFLLSCKQPEQPKPKGYQIEQREQYDEPGIMNTGGWVLQTSVLKDGWHLKYWNVTIQAVNDSIRTAEIQKAKIWLAWYKTIRDTVINVE